MNTIVNAYNINSSNRMVPRLFFNYAFSLYDTGENAMKNKLIATIIASKLAKGLCRGKCCLGNETGFLA